MLVFFFFLSVNGSAAPRASSHCQSFISICCFLCFLMLLRLACLVVYSNFCSASSFAPLMLFSLLYLCRCLFVQGFVFNCIFLLFFSVCCLNLSTHAPRLPPAVAHVYCRCRAEREEEERRVVIMIIALYV